MGKVVKLFVILIILIALGAGAWVAADKLPGYDSGDGQSFITADALRRLYGDDAELPEGITVLVPADCQADDDAWVKKGECQVDGLALTGSINSCGAGKEIWIRDPDHSSFVAAVGSGTCEEEERDCNVECPVDCEGDTYIDPNPPCITPTGVTLDGVNTCGVGLKTYELDTSADDYVAPIGKGTCAMEFKDSCEVGCPQGVRPETSCVHYHNPQKSANGCVVSKQPRARPVTYDEPGFQEWFRIPVDRKAPGCDGPDHMDSWWVPCTGPPRPVDCEGTWGVDGGWGQCLSEPVCNVQQEKERTFTRTKDAAHGGKCDLPAHNHTDSTSIGCPFLGPCCEVDTNKKSPAGDEYLQAQDNAPDTCVQNVNYDIITEKYPGACVAEGIPTTGVIPCCIGDGIWSPAIGSAASITDMSVPVAQGGYRNCDPSGKMTQYQTVYGQCNEEASKNLNVDCEYLGPWVREGGEACPSDGYYRWNRVTHNSGEPTTKTETCPVDCQGYHTNPECDTSCPVAAETKRRRWITTSDPKNGGAACPSDLWKDCPAIKCIDDYEATGAWVNRNKFMKYCNEEVGCNDNWNTTWTGSSDPRDRYRQEYHDWTSQATRDKYAEQCAKHCNDTSGCKAFQIDQQRCKLYSSAETPSVSLCDKNFKNVKDRTGRWKKQSDVWRLKSEDIDWKTKCGEWACQSEWGSWYDC